MPAVRRPKPIPKPRIEISTDTSGAQKAWEEVTPDRVHPGDIILGEGLVVERDYYTAESYTTKEKFGAWRFSMKNGKKISFKADEIIAAFVEVRGG